MRFCLAGASGFLGTALGAHLREEGHEVVRLVRRPARGPFEASWDPDSGDLDQSVIDGADVVVSLSGAPIAHWPWTSSYRRELVDSRVSTTTTIATAVARAPRPPVLLSGSGINAYGEDRADTLLVEGTPRGPGFLADVVEAWEAAAAPAVDAGARVCFLRTAPVLDGSGGLLKVISLPFRLGVGGRLGSGEQYFPVISLRDWVGAVSFLAEDEDASGPYNLVAPEPSTNAEFTKALAGALHRPSLLPVPSPAMRIALGGLSALALGSLRAAPRRLEEDGYAFADHDIGEVVATALGST
ncbi:TIGR01777 family oxidoreductase [Mumia sp. zg.B17]|uniref:TIGR01777 family oxidoreductase n=1 Tax=unclassified Mumia TaxID=2621872 RepID=UPI001C6DDCED|nr:MULTISPECIES: TIGR01777 family oxidoreductase [unclassified Mumia]MBW9206312.1 TIGR01777 family oxidoreductase [Mumia sp. zg.B17]MBW9211394.1 TIGR01777 family oxidoreductase [Mumia sp. zg.B21]